ncbi:MAG: glycogen-binding domain-containing protein [Elusimicrobia bacterium]|nr:glycogen-binding domain-containing protein [Elusimicrobiota bacterium]
MTKSKKFWALAAFACLILTGISGYSVYTRLAGHFLNDTVEIRPKPVPLRRGNENLKEEPSNPPEAPLKKAAGQQTANAAAKAETAFLAAREEKTISSKPEEPKKQKAIKVFFEYKSAAARSVSLAGSFTKWKEVGMAKKNGLWKAEVYILPGNYLYHFIVDGKKTLDPGKPKAPAGESMAVVE